jgi:DNA-binding response OmpR family regulator
MPLIFVVDGDPERRSFLKFVLEQAHYEVALFASMWVLEAVAEQRPAAIIIASELPDGSGITLLDLMRLRAELANTPIFMMTDKKTDERLGALASQDKVLNTPLVPERILDAVGAAVRGEHPPQSGAFPKSAEVLIDASAMKVFINGRELATTTLEFRLIDYMARHQGKVFTRDALLDAVWGDLQFVTPRSVDACIRRIRRKVAGDLVLPQFMRTIRGVGYKLDAQPKWVAGSGICNCKVCSAVRLRAQAPPEVRGIRPVKTMGRSAFFN